MNLQSVGDDVQESQNRSDGFSPFGLDEVERKSDQAADPWESEYAEDLDIDQEIALAAIVTLTDALKTSNRIYKLLINIYF